MKYALIGEKLSHSFSKIIHEAFGKYKYDLISLPLDDLEKFTNNNEYDGFNVTIPYKKSIMQFCDYISPSAQKIGCVNTVHKINGKLYAYNTDFDGFKANAKRGGIDFSGKKIAILGSGGTSLTAKAVATDQGAREIIIVSRKGAYSYDNIELWNDCEIIINTTPVGMFPDNGKSPLNLKDFPNCQGVIDVIYNPIKTKLVFDAESLGITGINGLYMLVYQAKSAFEIFTGEKISEDKTEEIYQNLYKDMSNIILIGMPGSGKSTLGKKIASSLNREIIDTDEEIVKLSNMTIPDIFQKYGEEYFRKIEADVARKCGGLSGKVIATGGGIVTNPNNFYSLKQNGILYYVKRDINNLSTKGRPLSKDLNHLKEMEKIRAPLYEKFADKTIDNNINLKNFNFKY